jgi:hypothetical protein
MPAEPRVLRVTAVNLLTGETSTAEIGAGNYVLLITDPCHVAHEQHYDTGTTILTLKRRRGGEPPTVVRWPAAATDAAWALDGPTELGAPERPEWRACRRGGQATDG